MLFTDSHGVQRSYLAIADNLGSAGSPESRPDLWAIGAPPGNQVIPPLASLSGAVVVEQQVLAAQPSAVSAVVEVENGATTTATITTLITRVGTPPLPTIDGDGVPFIAPPATFILGVGVP